MNISAKKMTEIQNILVRQLGDHHACPHCGSGFIPKDHLARETMTLYKILKPEFAKLGKRDEPAR